MEHLKNLMGFECPQMDTSISHLKPTKKITKSILQKDKREKKNSKLLLNSQPYSILVLSCVKPSDTIVIVFHVPSVLFAKLLLRSSQRPHYGVLEASQKLEDGQVSLQPEI